MNWQDFTAFALLATAMSFTPGPNTALSAALAANYGLPRAMPFIAAVTVGWGLLLAVCSLGVGALVLAAPLLGWAIKLVGVAYLLWLSFRLAFQTQLPGAATGRKLEVTFAQGVAMQFVNIKAWMAALAVVGGWIAGRSDAAQRFAVLLPVMLGFAFFSNFTYALLGSLLRDWLAGPAGTGRRLVAFNRVMAAVLVVTAIWMLFI